MNINREEYLKRDLIPNVKYIVNDEHIIVSSDSTIFININNCQRVSLDNVLYMVKELKSTAKTNKKIKLKGINKIITEAKEYYNGYLTVCNDVLFIYDETKEAIKTIKKDGIHIGFRDDEVLNELSKKIRKISEHYYRNTDYSKFLDVYYRLNDILNKREWENPNLITVTYKF